MRLRYGANPHQAARLDLGTEPPFRVRSGHPSYINVLDALSAWGLVRDASASASLPAAASFKHVSPAGAAIAGPLDVTMRSSWELGKATCGDALSAYVRARDADPRSSFGDLEAYSGEVDDELADFLLGVVSDGVVAPSFAPGAVARLAAKKRGTFLVIEADPGMRPPRWESRVAAGVRLDQEVDDTAIEAALLSVVVGDALTTQEVEDGLLGMVTMRYTQSNSVAYVKNGMTLGVGAGQQSRIDCSRLAGARADAWWMRRHELVADWQFLAGVRRQERLAWQVAVAQGDLSRDDEERLAGILAHPLLLPSFADRSRWLRTLRGVVVCHDGAIPFRDNIDDAYRHGVRVVVEPGGSSRGGETEAACASYGMTLVQTGLRLFRH